MPNPTFNHILSSDWGTLESDQVHSGRIDPELYARPIISTIDTWDEKAKIEYFSTLSSGRRPAWNLPQVAVTQEPVNTIRSSVNTRQQNTTIAQVAASVVSPVYNPPVTGDLRPFKPVANMQASIKPLSAVEITFSTMISTPQADSARFVIYRNGQRISQEYQQYTAAGDVRSLLSGTYIDQNPSLNQIHSYQLYVRPVNSAVTFYQLGRVFQVSDLRAS